MPISFLSLNIDEEFNALYKEYKGINIPLPEAEYGASALDLLKNPKYNKAGTFAYLDSPYICTMGYAKGFDKKMMEDLIDSCKAFKGDFVFSCRINLPSGTLKTLRGKKGESKNVSTDNKKKFIWFMEQWLATDYKVLFMIPEKTEADKNITMLAYIKKCLNNIEDIILKEAFIWDLICRL